MDLGLCSHMAAWGQYQTPQTHEDTMADTDTLSTLIEQAEAAARAAANKAGYGSKGRALNALATALWTARATALAIEQGQVPR